MQISVSIDQSQLSQLREAVRRAPAKVTRAIMRAANRAAATAKTHAKRIIAQNLGIPGGALITPHRFGATGSQSTGTAIRVIKATPSNLEAHLWISGRRIPVWYFKAKERPIKQRKPVSIKIDDTKWVTVRNRPGGVSWRMHGARKYEKDAFIATMPSGHVGVFKRKGATRKIVELFGPSVPGVAKKSADFKRALLVDVREVLRKRLQHELGRINKS